MKDPGGGVSLVANQGGSKTSLKGRTAEPLGKDSANTTSGQLGGMETVARTKVRRCARETRRKGCATYSKTDKAPGEEGSLT